ncbi:hypothetical protein J7F03_36945 [Streptomyces sp. ISL-43]|uniref:hypothetical protein n=1 Tax=Streptomyces sp. ISL-43 TaxID=2819183 RepID=UPI001BE57877|nr:hypothetical protein [Streptomyces sp. ISL-43]MBT2452544.1 hypothetical protein [Streptomyces sp. ISL-43]
MDADVAGLVASGVATLGGLLVTDAYERVVRSRLLGLLGGGFSPERLPGIEDFDRLHRGLSDATQNGDARARRGFERELRGYVRSMIDADPVGVADLLSSVCEDSVERTGGAAASVSLTNNTIFGPVLGSGVQHNSF